MPLYPNHRCHRRMVGTRRSNTIITTTATTTTITTTTAPTGTTKISPHNNSHNINNNNHMTDRTYYTNDNETTVFSPTGESTNTTTNYNNNNNHQDNTSGFEIMSDNNNDVSFQPTPPSLATTTKGTTGSVIQWNFITMSILFSLNHGCVVACLGLATSQLGSSVGAIQSGILYFFYTMSSLFGSTYIVHTIGSKYSLVTGMILYCLYVTSFYLAAAAKKQQQQQQSSTLGEHNNHDDDNEDVLLVQYFAYFGAAIGGLGAGFLWTAQGSYFAQCCKLIHTMNVTTNNTTTTNPTTTTTITIFERDGLLRDTAATATTTTTPTTTTTLLLEDITSRLAGIFAVIYLVLEISLRLLSTVAIGTINLSWERIFAIYTIVTVVSTIFMIFITDVDKETTNNDSSNTITSNNTQAGTAVTTPLRNRNDEEQQLLLTQQQQQQQQQRQQTPQVVNNNESITISAIKKITLAVQILLYDPKMKYMIGFNTLFGLTAAFLNSYINGTVLPIVLNDPTSHYVGFFTAWISCIAAGTSYIFSTITTTPTTPKAAVLSTTTTTTTTETSLSSSNNASLQQQNIVTTTKRKVWISYIGCVSFGCVAIPFILFPNYHHSSSSSSSSVWGWSMIFFIYTMHGIGRATFESTFKSIFVDYFPTNSIGAFANIVFQNGFAGSIGYILSIYFPCTPTILTSSTTTTSTTTINTNNTNYHCVQYEDGTYHNVYQFELLIVLAAIGSIISFWRASVLYNKEQQQQQQQQQ